MDRLRSRKAAVAGQLEQLRAATCFAPPSDAPVSLDALQEPAARPAAAQGPAHTPIAEQPEEEGYTERLLRAKKKVWKQGEKDSQSPLPPEP